MKSITRKLNDIENNVLQKQKIGSTMLCSCSWTEPEQTICEKARLLSQMGIPLEELAEGQKTLIDKAGEIIRFRIFDLFTTYLESLCRDDHSAKILIHERFLWFIQQLRKEIEQEIEVSEIMRNTPEDCEVDRVDEYYRIAPKCFTEKSWFAVQDDLSQRWVEHMKKTGKWDELMKKKKC